MITYKTRMKHLRIQKAEELRRTQGYKLARLVVRASEYGRMVTPEMEALARRILFRGQNE